MMELVTALVSVVNTLAIIILILVRKSDGKKNPNNKNSVKTLTRLEQAFKSNEVYQRKEFNRLEVDLADLTVRVGALERESARSRGP